MANSLRHSRNMIVSPLGEALLSLLSASAEALAPEQIPLN